jgi:hypothetical protein
MDSSIVATIGQASAEKSMLLLQAGHRGLGCGQCAKVVAAADSNSGSCRLRVASALPASSVSSVV